MKCFVEDKYVYSYKVLHGIENISSILPIVLIMDSTYRTNKYRLSTNHLNALQFAHLFISHLTSPSFVSH
jgi:hypothetical protein